MFIDGAKIGGKKKKYLICLVQLFVCLVLYSVGVY